MAIDAQGSDDLLKFARMLVKALEEGDDRARAQAVHWIASGELLPWQRELQHIAESLRETLCGTQVTRELSRLARRDLPDAKQSLGYVLDLTEDAAHRTLEAVETAQPLASSLAASIAQCRARWCASDRHAAQPEDTAFVALLERAEQECAQLKASLSDVLMAQGFQDLTGQIIRRVGDLVSDLEDHLAALGPASTDPDQDGSDALRRGIGAQVPGSDDAGTVSGQQDVDDLLAKLGV